MKKYSILILLIMISGGLRGQQQNGETLSLEDLSAFRQQAGNWLIVGDVMMDPAIDIHAIQKAIPPGTGKKKNRQPKQTAAPRQAVTYTEGKGILLNMNDDTRKDNLVTNLEHGDIDLELEVMLPKGSNSGIYLQGRYEVQLLDSWGIRDPSFGDIGGIYRNWETQPGKIYMGKAPLSNPAKAPGLWQKMRISFIAPKFDTTGKKVSNARFVYVELNGIRIHNNTEVPLPTGGPIENNEKPTGPLMIQGDHGPVAFRNIRYRLLKEGTVSLGDITFKNWTGSFRTISDFASLKPAFSGRSDELTCEVVENDNEYGTQYNGTVRVPEDGEYAFTLMMTGGGKFSVNDQVLVDIQRPDAWVYQQKTISLKAGSYPFEIFNFKGAPWMAPRLGLFVQSPGMHRQALHAFNSFPPNENPSGPILVNAGSEPRLLRAFLDFQGDRSKRLTHTLGVGLPEGLNYVYDLKAGNVVCVWRGAFVDATPMWEDRGDGSFRPLGAPQFLFMGPALSVLPGDQESFPGASDEKVFRSKGYVIDDSTKLPVFRYSYQGIEVIERVLPEDNFKSIGRRISIAGGGQQQLYLKLAEGEKIEAMPDGSFVINDKGYYLRINAGGTPSIREVNGKKELVLAVTESSIHYSIIW